MKRILSIVFLIAAALLLLNSCMLMEEPEECIVTFVYNNGEKNDKYEVMSNERVEKPKDPERENYIFAGWYKDKALTKPYDFDMDAGSDLKLYAKWEPDYVKINNELMTGKIKANVKIYVTHHKTYSNEYATGSGVIIKKSGDTYYALTNNHVVSSESSVISTEVEIMDVYGNLATGTVIYGDPEYDLALVSFRSETKLAYVTVDDTFPDEREAVIAIGQPNGQINAVTYGNIVDIEVAGEGAQSKTSNVTFPVFWHTANVDQGSSGGALLDLDYNLVGLNYATSTDEDGNFAFGFAIPAEKINEFLDKLS